MSIRAKLMGLVAAMLVVVLLGFGVFALATQLVRTLTREQQLLVDLRQSIGLEYAEAAKVLVYPADEQYDRFVARYETSGELLAHVQDQVTLLPRVSPQVREMIDTVVRLKSLQAQRQANFQSAVQGVLDAEDNILTFGGGRQPILPLVTSEYVIEHENFPDLAAAVEQLQSAVFISVQTLESSISTLDETFDEIERQIVTINRIGSLVALGVVAILVAIATLVALGISRRIGRSLASIGEGLGVIQQRDLTREIPRTSNDEIGTLTDSLNTFFASLRGNVERIKQEADTNESIKDELVTAAHETASFTAEISRNAKSMTGEVSDLDESIGAATEETDAIVTEISSLDERIQSQMAMVEESTASINQMIASLGNMNQTTSNSLAAAEKLVQTAQTGDKRIGALLERIEGVNEQAGEISRIASVIQGIAASTNMLAMNAAIEAAHAGEYGRGFSVVAQEIRSLAEASAQNSKEISTELKQIVGAITEATEESRQSRVAFTQVDQGVQSVARALQEISVGMNEIEGGGREVLTAMRELSDASTAIQAGSVSMNERSGQIRQRIASIRDGSRQVSIAVDGISSELERINEAMDNLSRLHDRLGVVSASLKAEVESYRTAGDGDDDPDRAAESAGEDARTGEGSEEPPPDA